MSLPLYITSFLIGATILFVSSRMGHGKIQNRIALIGVVLAAGFFLYGLRLLIQ